MVVLALAVENETVRDRLGEVGMAVIVVVGSVVGLALLVGAFLGGL